VRSQPDLGYQLPITSAAQKLEFGAGFSKASDKRVVLEESRPMFDS